MAESGSISGPETMVLSPRGSLIPEGGEDGGDVVTMWE